MSKFIVKSIIILTVMIVGMNLGKEDDTVKDVELCAKVDMYDTLDELSEGSDLVVVGTKLSEDEPTIVYENDVILYAYTLSDFYITKVIQSGNGEKLENEEIRVLENEFYDEEENINYHIAGYNKMINGESYILYLSYSQENDWYVPTGVVAGKIPLDEKEKNITTSDKQIIDEVENIEKEVKKEYNFKKLKKEIKLSSLK